VVLINLYDMKKKFTVLLLSLSNITLARVYPEHRDITPLAIEKLIK